MSVLTIQRVGWAGYVVTTEAGTRILIDPFLHRVDNTGIHAGVSLPDSPFSVKDLADCDVIAVI